MHKNILFLLISFASVIRCAPNNKNTVPSLVTLAKNACNIINLITLKQVNPLDGFLCSCSPDGTIRGRSSNGTGIILKPKSLQFVPAIFRPTDYTLKKLS